MKKADLFLLVFILLFATSCKPPTICNPGEMGSQCGMVQSFLQGISAGTPTGTAPTISFGGSPYSFPQYMTTAVTPTVTGSIGSCTASPGLPQGLVIDSNNCVISGKPLLVSNSSYTITAGSAQANISISVIGTVSQVQFGTLPGNYSSSSSASLYSGTPGTTIYYTTDGSVPTTASAQYTGTAINFSTNTTIKALATKTGYTNSPVGSATYTINGTASYAVGGWVSGLQGTMVIQNNGADDLTLTGNGPFVFATPLNGTAINVTVLNQPTQQTCRVDVDNSGVASTGSPAVTMPAANFLNVSVVCDGDSIPAPTYSYTGPTQHATYTTDYTTTDNVTGLVWKTCNEGLSGATCGTGTAPPYNWIPAGTQCRTSNDANAGAGYAGRKDWRLPTINELKSILKGTTPYIDATAFPATGMGGHWSSSTVVGSTASAWDVYFNTGLVAANSKTANSYIRCVAGP